MTLCEKLHRLVDELDDAEVRAALVLLDREREAVRTGAAPRGRAPPARHRRLNLPCKRYRTQPVAAAEGNPTSLPRGPEARSSGTATIRQKRPCGTPNLSASRSTLPPLASKDSTAALRTTGASSGPASTGSSVRQPKADICRIARVKLESLSVPS